MHGNSASVVFALTIFPVRFQIQKTKCGLWAKSLNHLSHFLFTCLPSHSQKRGIQNIMIEQVNTYCTGPATVGGVVSCGATTYIAGRCYLLHYTTLIRINNWAQPSWQAWQLRFVHHRGLLARVTADCQRVTAHTSQHARLYRL